MKLSLALAASLLLLGTAGSALAAGPDVFAGGGLGGVKYDYGDGAQEPSGYTAFALASGAYNFTPVIGAQGDVVLRFEHTEFEGNEQELTFFDGAGHLFYRDSDKFLAGIMGQVGHDEASYNGSEGSPRDRSYVGAEFQGFFDAFTLYGQAGVLWVNIPDMGDISGTGAFATLEGRYFVTPNFKLDIHGGVSKVAPDEATDFVTTNLNLGLGAEYRLDDSPLSFFAKLDWFDGSVEDDSFGSSSEVRLLVGLKGSFGTDTLQERDRAGASLKPVDAEFSNFVYLNN